MVQSAVLLNAKLLPPALPAAFVERGELYGLLAAGLENRGTAVLAGPGYGKSSLLAGFLQARSEPHVWLRLDKRDRDPWLILRYLVEGIRRQVPDFAQNSQVMWDSRRENKEDGALLASVFIQDAEELSERFLLVLDGVEYLKESAPLAEMLEHLLAYLPGTLHLTLLGRSASATLAQALAPATDLTHVVPDQLRFSMVEARALAERMKLRLTEDDLQRIYRRTRGWVTGLLLFFRALQLGRSESLTSDALLADSEAQVFDYLTQAVFRELPEETRRFLLDSSLTPILDPDLLEEVLESSAVRPIIRQLVDQHLFVTPIASTGGYEYDPLFRQFLHRELRANRSSDEIRSLHQRYAQGLERRDRPALALEHLIEAGDQGSLVAMLRRKGRQLLRDGVFAQVEESTQLLGVGGLTDPAIDDLRGEIHRVSGDFAAASRWFENALRPDQPEALTGHRRALALQGLAHSILKLGRLDEARAHAERALADAQDDDELMSRILNTQSVVWYREGDIARAIDGWQKALVHARRSSNPNLTLMIAHNLGLPHALTGDFDRAAECFRMLTDPGNEFVGPETGAAMLNLARIATLRGDYDSAATLLDDARETARKWNLRSLAADVSEAQGNLLRERGDLDGAEASYAEARRQFTQLGLVDLVLNLEEEEAVLAARRGNGQRAEHLASGLVARARGQNDDDALASACLALGEIRATSGDPASAREPLAIAEDHSRRTLRAYQLCASRLWAALAELRASNPAAARAAAGEAVGISERFHYSTVIARIAQPYAELRELLGSLDSCPADLGRLLRTANEPVEAPPAGGSSDLRVCLLGPVEVHSGNRLIPERAWKLKRALRVFCVLAASRDYRVTKDRLAEAVWGEADPAAVEKNFHPTISFLRGALNHGRTAKKNFVLYQAGAYSLNPAYAYSLDCHEFETTIQEARAAAEASDIANALSLFERALSLYRGDFMAELYDEWAEPQRARYQTLYRAALLETSELNLRQGNLKRCVDDLRKLSEYNPVDEGVAARLMLALGALGQRGDVEREFQRLSAVLKRDLAATPSAVVTRAFRRAMSGDDVAG